MGEAPTIKNGVALRTGPPTKAELDVYYPPKFTWAQLKTFVSSGDLGLLKRDKTLQKRYDIWSEGIVRDYGSVVSYLLDHRLQWGKPDTQSLLTSALVDDRYVPDSDSQETKGKEWFCWETPSKYISIIQNDWPYSVPTDVEHTLIWTQLPIYHPSLVSERIRARIEQDGVWGFTGASSSSDLALPTLEECLPSLAEWGITIDKLIVSPPPTEEEKVEIERAGSEVGRYVRMRWDERVWETAWFVNPPRLQSVPGLAHIHVFARHKS